MGTESLIQTAPYVVSETGASAALDYSSQLAQVIELLCNLGTLGLLACALLSLLLGVALGLILCRRWYI